MPFRAFIAVEAGNAPGVRPLLFEVAALAADLKVVRAENLHVTLAFLGDVEQGLVPDLERAIAEASRGEAPFEASLRGVGTFPPRGAPRVVFAALDGADALVRIAGRLRPLLQRLGVPVDERPFAPHVTLARARSGRGAAAVRAFVEANRGRDAGALAVEDVRLVASRLSPAGPTYETVRAVRLGAAA